MVSDRQKKLKRKAYLFGIISYGLLVALTIFFVISACANLTKVQDGVQIFTDEAKKIIVSMSITAIIGLIATIFLKEGARTFVWIVCVVLGSLVYKDTGMYIALVCWLIDDYVIHKFYLYFKEKYKIRKEIDIE